MQNFLIKIVNDLASGDIILHPIYRSDGLLMVSRYKILEGSILLHIKKQVDKDLEVLTVQSIEAFESVKEYWINQPSRYIEIMEKIRSQHQSFMKIQLEESHFIDPMLYGNMRVEEKQNEPNSNEMLFLSPLWDSMDTMIDSNSIHNRIDKIFVKLQNVIKNDKSIYELYNRLSHYHDVLMIHSANTACLSFIIGLTLELSDEDIIDLSLAALFADIGFTRFPQDEFIKYLKNYSAFQSKELLVNHIKYSVEELSNSPSCRKKSIIFGVLDHHEHVDGSGLPGGKKGNEIHLFSKIISIAQQYDLLVGGYTDKGVYPTFGAYQMMWSQLGKVFDENIFKLFLHRTSVFKVGEEIQLPDYKKGIILGFTDYIHFPLAPKVKLQDGSIINLFKRMKMTME